MNLKKTNLILTFLICFFASLNSYSQGKAKILEKAIRVGPPLAAATLEAIHEVVTGIAGSYFTDSLDPLKDGIDKAKDILDKGAEEAGDIVKEDLADYIAYQKIMQMRNIIKGGPFTFNNARDVGEVAKMVMEIKEKIREVKEIYELAGADYFTELFAGGLYDLKALERRFGQAGTVFSYSAIKKFYDNYDFEEVYTLSPFDMIMLQELSLFAKNMLKNYVGRTEEAIKELADLKEKIDKTLRTLYVVAPVYNRRGNDSPDPWTSILARPSYSPGPELTEGSDVDNHPCAKETKQMKNFMTNPIYKWGNAALLGSCSNIMRQKIPLPSGEADILVFICRYNENNFLSFPGNIRVQADQSHCILTCDESRDATTSRYFSFNGTTIKESVIGNGAPVDQILNIQDGPANDFYCFQNTTLGW